MFKQINHIGLANKPFYKCLLSDLAFEWQQGWRWPCFDAELSAFAMYMHVVSIRTTWCTQQIIELKADWVNATYKKLMWIGHRKEIRKLAFESPYGGQFTLSTQLINQIIS